MQSEVAERHNLPATVRATDLTHGAYKLVLGALKSAIALLALATAGATHRAHCEVRISVFAANSVLTALVRAVNVSKATRITMALKILPGDHLWTALLDVTSARNPR